MTEPTPDDTRSTEIVQIRCADAIELVTEHLDGELSAGDVARFEAHLAGCEACRVFLDQIRMTVTLTAGVGGEQLVVVPANFDALAAELVERGQRRGSST